MTQELTHRRLAYLRLLDGWQKFATEHKEISFGLSDSPETLEAEKRVAEAVIEYENGAPLTIVRDAFNIWKQSWIVSSQPQTLFQK